MKKGMNILFVSLVAALLSSSALEAREAQTGTPTTITKTQVAPVIAPVKKVKRRASGKCTNCANSNMSNTYSEAPIKRCAEKVKTVVYRDSCGNGCGFPVSVRVPSNCRGNI